MCSAQPPVVDSTDEALKQKLRQYSQFFDRLVELVPARYYIDSEREEPANTRFLKKNAKAEAKRVAKDAAKKRKREKLDPGSVQTTLDVQREQARKKQRLPSDAAAAEAPDLNGSGGPALQYAVPTGTDPSAGQLRERLQTRIEAMRRDRKAVEEKKQRARAAKEWRRQASGRALPQQQREAAPAQTGGQRAAPTDAAPMAGPKKQQQKGPAPEPDEAKLSFGRLEVAGGGRAGSKKKKRGKAPSKAELLEAARAKAEQRAALEGTREGRVAYEQDAWQSAMARARGERVLDDPKLLSRSLKKEEKARQKKGAAWKERQGLQRKEQATKQKKRAENLKARTDTKLKNRKDKREKKLLRAGFEGRRDTFIGSDK